MEVTDEQGKALLKLARRTIAFRLGCGEAPESGDDCRDLQQRGAVFVTLKKQGRLRGCIGNLEPVEARAFLRRLACTCGPDGGLLLGLDLVKDAAILQAAYDDAAGVTAAFNLNILRVLNDRLGADLDPAAFEHVAFYDAERQWIEMRLRARRPVVARVPAAGVEIALAAGEEIRTELSCKYTRDSLSSRLAGTGLRLERWTTDPEGLFASALLRRS